MTLARTAALATLAALPLAAAAQSSVTHARIVPEPTVIYREVVPAPTVVYSDDVRDCLARQDSLADRRAFIERERGMNDREAHEIAREGARLADELRRLNSGDTAAVAEYNMRSAEHNRRVEAHNRRIADLNGAVAALNGDTANTPAYCNLWVSRLR